MALIQTPKGVVQKKYQKATAHVMVHLFKFITTTPQFTRQELLDRFTLGEVTVHKLLREMRKARLIYICDWTEPAKRGGTRAHIYAYGDKKDVPQPTIGNAAASKAYRRRKQLRAAEVGVDRSVPGVTVHRLGKF